MGFTVQYMDRVALYDRTFNELFGVVITPGPMMGMSIGNYDNQGTLGVVTHSIWGVYCITDGTIAPPPPLAGVGIDPLATVIGVFALCSVIVAIPVGYSIGVPLWVRKKRSLLAK